MSITDQESAAREAAPGGSATPDAAPAQELVADVFARDCSSRAAFEVVTSKWASLALLALGEGGYRFNALRRRVEGVSEKMLSQTLQALERDGMVTREVVTTIPPRVEYALTPLGEGVAERLRSLADLLEANVTEAARESARESAGESAAT
ncbi:winged helix-turn-helix transcriptional regulator [Promicromonospora iranensis]|uniref:DNA-binding HxlR family transcriptional regulator n=1 Tax=Promicromonospora iranensis TaxID=1105144 RepID=A0ABU2CWR5_9MICO|nr:helix-turn-helix domain-containing protein [Promicromonospora iranensis]MDR7385723.1 DNA-binding HxlR family transcriptional regulator [Promicromonospora iranensis]